MTQHEVNKLNTASVDQSASLKGDKQSLPLSSNEQFLDFDNLMTELDEEKMTNIKGGVKVHAC
jgi:hypothetical protein